MILLRGKVGRRRHLWTPTGNTRRGPFLGGLQAFVWVDAREAWGARPRPGWPPCPFPLSFLAPWPSVFQSLSFGTWSVCDAGAAWTGCWGCWCVQGPTPAGCRVDTLPGGGGSECEHRHSLRWCSMPCCQAGRPGQLPTRRRREPRRGRWGLRAAARGAHDHDTQMCAARRRRLP